MNCKIKVIKMYNNKSFYKILDHLQIPQTKSEKEPVD